MEVGLNKKSEIKWAREEIKWELRKRTASGALREVGRERQNVKKKQREEIGRNNKQFVAVVGC
jgi:hypothetical protein